MAKIKDLSKLFRAIAMHDLRSATECAREMIKGEEAKGHFQSARELSSSLRIENSGFLKLQNSVLAANNPVSSGVLTHLENGVDMSELELSSKTVQILEDIIKERRFREVLQSNEISRRWRLLFHGPPGCGKSITARALGQRAGLPTYMVKFDALIGAYLGQTAARLREIFQFAVDNPCVLLFDEVDAMAKRRGSPAEVGELDRIVIAFMQELEHAQGEGFLVATSNLPNSLDEALWRRFDVHIEFPKPTPKALLSYAKKRANRFGIKLNEPLRLDAIKLTSFANVEKLILNEARSIILKQKD